MHETMREMQPGQPGGMDESTTVLVNRRPIYDPKLNTVGYETQVNSGVIGQVAFPPMLKLLAENLDILKGNCWGLVTLPHSAILAGDYKVFSPEQMVIGVEEGSTEGQFFDSLTKLAAQGYRLALPVTDDNLRRFAGPGDILTLNLKQVAGKSLPARFEQLSRQKARLGKQKPGLLASGIQTYQDLEIGRNLGFDFFEGSFFCAPNLSVKSVPVTKLAAIRLIAALQDPEVRLQDLEDIIRYDVSLSHRLLQFVNSAYVGLQREVASLKHAVSMIGIGRIRRWASLLLFASMDHKPRELVITAAVRARMCEQLADSQTENRQATFFTVGLLSVLDALLNQPMIDAVQGVPLSGEIREALVNRSGPLGTTLRAVIAYEQSDWKRHALLRFRPSKLRDSYMDSLQWTHTVVSGLMI